MTAHILRRIFAPSLIVSALLWVPGATAGAQQTEAQPTSIVRQIQAANEQQEMTVHTSRILTLSPELTAANRIPRAQVNNPDILDVTPLSATQIQISAKKPGVTQVNLWDENGAIYTVDVIVYGDAQELSMILEHEFPNASLRVVPLANSVLISGYVDQPGDINGIMQIAEQYYPKVINGIQVGGVHQVLLHVKAMEVSRTKLRNLGFDWAIVGETGSFVTGTAGLIDPVSLARSSFGNIQFDVLGSSSEFFGVLEALRQDNLAKVLAEPTLMTSSGRPAYFDVGGEVPIPVPQGLGTTAIEYKRYGTRVDFVPFVEGDGRIRLEVRPRVSELDYANSVVIADTSVPGLRNREAETGVTLQAGQTLAIAGLVQNRVESSRRGVPWVSDLPYAGALFRRVEERNNEIELLIFVTPELVDGMDAGEVPPCSPGSRTTSPTDVQLGLRGHIEVPKCCPPGTRGTVPGRAGPIMPAGPMLSDPPASLPPAPLPPPAGASRTRPGRWNAPRSWAISPAAAASGKPSRLPGFMGPVGYEHAD